MVSSPHPSKTLNYLAFHKINGQWHKFAVTFQYPNQMLVGKHLICLTDFIPPVMQGDLHFNSEYLQIYSSKDLMLSSTFKKLVKVLIFYRKFKGRHKQKPIHPFSQ